MAKIFRYSTTTSSRELGEKYLVEREEDLDALSVLFMRPNGLVLESFLKEAERIGGFAEENGVLVMGWGPMDGDTVI